MTVGTAAYMSPEQIQGVKLDQRTDIYSMGIMLYEMLAGRVPFERPKDSDSDFPILTAHTSQPPPPPRQFAPQIPAAMETAILKALAKKPEERFQSCEEFLAALGLEPAPTRDVTAAAPAKAASPAKPLPAAPANKVVIDPITLKPISPAPPRPASQPLEPQSPAAKPGKQRETHESLAVGSGNYPARIGGSGRHRLAVSQGAGRFRVGAHFFRAPGGSNLGGFQPLRAPARVGKRGSNHKDMGRFEPAA